MKIFACLVLMEEFMYNWNFFDNAVKEKRFLTVPYI